MAYSPNQSPPGKQFELRLTANDLEFDRLLAELTLPESRARLPGFLHLFSEKTLMHTVTDRDIDGHSQIETTFRAFQMKVMKYHRTKFSLGPTVSKERQVSPKEELRVKLGLNLGIQATSDIVIPPFFTNEDKDQALIPFYYTIPDPVRARTMESAFERLTQYLGEEPRGIVDELTLVQTALRDRSIRTRTRPENSVTEPIQLSPQTDNETQGPSSVLSEVG